jgi:hypothetical protein
VARVARTPSLGYPDRVMAGALFFICIFLITLIGGLLLRPDPIRSIRDYRTTEAVEERKQTALRMAEFLTRNPTIVQQAKLNSLRVVDARNVTPGEVASSPPAHTEPLPVPPPSRAQESFSIRFQGSDLRFMSIAEYDAWLHSTIRSGGDVLKQADFGEDPDLMLSTLQKCLEIDHSPAMMARVKERLLEQAGTWLNGPDGSSQQAAQKALQRYLEIEENKDLGKKTVDQILESHRGNQ